MKLKTFYFISCLAILAAAVYYAPFFLIVSDPPVKSDAVVLFLGDVAGTRAKEAHQLMQEGFAEYLIIPATGQVKKLNPAGTLIRIEWQRPKDVSNQQTNEPTNQGTSSLKTSHLILNTASWLEDTQKEAVIAREMMEHLGCKSVILVSSPYHMRRIKIIADRVFGDSITVLCAPTRHDAPGVDFWLFNSRNRKFILTEYAKIGWFLLYSPFA